METMLPAKVNVPGKLALFHEHWSPKAIADVNGQSLKLVKFQGEFVWHHHDEADELFYVLRGEFVMQFREGNVPMRQGELIVVPRGVEHCPKAENEVEVLLMEPLTMRNTGNVEDARTAVVESI
jgi:mannose-6-phosphate isomerase-like protein (cupin superfamily)